MALVSVDERRESRLLVPTLHIEVVIYPEMEEWEGGKVDKAGSWVSRDVAEHLITSYETLTVGQDVHFEYVHVPIQKVEVSGYTGPEDSTGFHKVKDMRLDIIVYRLKSNTNASRRPSIVQLEEEDVGRVLDLPNEATKDEWNSLAFDEDLPARLLRCLVRMVGIISQPELNLGNFNLNRLCLLHGPSGSGKSTLCRALAQKLSIRLRRTFPHSMLVEINANALLSKYFAESGKLISSTFDKIVELAYQPSTFICVVIDEVETIAGSREKATSGRDCRDSLRATNQLLTALDRLRNLPNVIVLSTSNLVEAIDPAFLDRVDIKQEIPRPSVGAIYNIFRSCLNELIRGKLITGKMQTQPVSSDQQSPKAPHPAKNRKKVVGTISSFAEANVKLSAQPFSPSSRVLLLAQRCQGLSGRTLRRLPILGLTMHTWGGEYSLADAVTALESAAKEEMNSSEKSRAP